MVLFLRSSRLIPLGHKLIWFWAVLDCYICWLDAFMNANVNVNVNLNVNLNVCPSHGQ